MTDKESSNLYENGLSKATDEENLIDTIILRIHKITRPDNSVLTKEIEGDLLNLRTKFGESDFKKRFLSTRERALQQFIDDFPSMLGYWNRELINVHSNNAYATYFGKKPVEIKGRSILELLGEKIFSLNLPFIKGVLSGNPQTFERDIPTPSGNIKSTLANYIPHFVSDEVIGFFVIVTDITEKKRLEEKAKALETSLYEQSRLSSLGQMASGIAHEINNPVAIIYSDACLLIKEFNKPNPDKKAIIERLSEIENTSLRIEKIVDGLRSIQAGLVDTSIAAHNLIRILEQVLSICSNRFAKAGIKINWNRPTNEIWALCNDIQVSEILVNILNNAFDELKNTENGHVIIEVIKSSEGCEIHLSNNGPQIRDEERKNLFLPFYTTKGKKGTGLGLKISKDLAKANGGDLKISENKETEFILFLKSPDDRS